MAAPDVEMQVTDSGGEISASIEETNRIRASLGLKPLVEGGGGGTAHEDRNREEEAKARGRERAEELAKEDAEEAMRDKLDAARRQRLLHQKLTGQSLGEQLAGEEMDSAAAWVAKSRVQEDDRKERRKESKAKRAAAAASRSAVASQSAMYDEMDAMAEASSELAGAVVGHSADDFKAGETTILTLADQSVVTEAEGGTSYALNDDAEMLENVALAEDWKRKHNKEMASGEHYKYNPYAAEGSGAILQKYEDEPGRKTMTLDAKGTVDEAKLKRLAEIKSRLAASQAATAGGGSAQQYDLSATSEKVSLALEDALDGCMLVAC